VYPSSNALPYGFRIVGPCTNDRRLIDWPSAFDAYSQCDPRAVCDREAYLSAFTFGDAFRKHLTRTGTTKGYIGDCWSPWLWFDIDRDDIDAATHDARRLASWLMDRFAIAGDALLAFYSGSKGYHLALPTSLWNPEPSNSFHARCRRLAESVAAAAGVAIDSGVYDRVRAFRAPNSRHPKTGRFKRSLSLHELLNLRASRIIELAETPEPFEIPDPPAMDRNATRLWNDAAAAVDAQRTIATQRRSNGNGSQSLNRSTMEFIRDGATTGDRHRLLFSAAANLAELGCSFELASALLAESALDSGLAPSEVRRQIECGLKHTSGEANNG
jgi:hypothetical protein